MRVKIPSIAFRRVFAACILLLTVIMLIWPQSSPLFSSLNRDSISYISGSILSVENEHLTPAVSQVDRCWASRHCVSHWTTGRL